MQWIISSQCQWIKINDVHVLANLSCPSFAIHNHCLCNSLAFIILLLLPRPWIRILCIGNSLQSRCPEFPQTQPNWPLIMGRGEGALRYRLLNKCHKTHICQIACTDWMLARKEGRSRESFRAEDKEHGKHFKGFCSQFHFMELTTRTTRNNHCPYS